MTSPEVSPRDELGLAWAIGVPNGWGTYGLHLALGVARRPGLQPRLLVPADPQTLPPLVRARLAEPLRRAQEPVGALPPVVAHRVFNRFAIASPGAWARRNVGIPFVEDTALGAADVARSMAFDLIVAGSSWNAALLRGAGVPNVTLVVQGVDPSLFHPAPPLRVFGDRFVVFSGGKLEYRKGQDIVVAAFRAFRGRHPDALLVCAWQHSAGRLFAGLGRAGHVAGVPEGRDGIFDIGAWLCANGVPAGAAIDVGPVRSWALAPVMREASVAVFPNRCEGGTNLMAMECMACGVPTILSRNTGHLDLVTDAGCYPLERQAPVPAPVGEFRGTEGWGESDVDEIVAALEAAYDDPADAARRGREAAACMRALPWAAQIDRLVDLVEPLFGR